MSALATMTQTAPAPQSLPGGLDAPALLELDSQRQVVSDVLDWLAVGTPGLGVVTGTQGSGKSRLLEQVVLALAEDEDRLIGVIPGDEGKLSDAAFLKQAIGAFGTQPAGRTGIELITEFRHVLIDHQQDASPAVLLIDDAAFGGSRLEILRSMLSSDPVSSPPGPARLQIVLFGPPELADRIARRRQLSTLVGYRGTVPALEATELRRVIQNWHRHSTFRSSALPPLTREGESTIELVAAGNPGRAVDIAANAVQESRRLGGMDIGRILVHAVTRTEAPSVAHRARNNGTKGDIAKPALVQQRLMLPGLENAPDSDGGVDRET